jgi:hypothetical protein
MLKNKSRYRNSWEPMMWASMHSKDSNLFLLGMAGGRAWTFFLVPNVFPWSFQYVPSVLNVFPIMFPIASHFIHNLCPKFFYSCNLYRQPEDNNISLLQLFKASFLLLFFGDGPINDVHHKRKIIELWRFPQLINMRFFHSEHTFLSWYPNKYYPGIMIIIIFSSVLYLG